MGQFDYLNINYSRQFKFIKTATRLLAKTLEYFSKQTDLIADLIRFCLHLITTYQKNLRKVTLDPNQQMRSDDELSRRTSHMLSLKDFFKNYFFNSISVLFQRECNESLLVNFGIESRSHNEILKFNEQQASLESIRLLQASLNNDQKQLHSNEMAMHRARIVDYFKKRDMYSSIQLDEDFYSHSNLNEMSRLISKGSIYFGCQNEAEIYCLLLDIAGEFKGESF